MKKISAVLVPATSNDLYGTLYKSAQKAIKNRDALLTNSSDQILNAGRKGLLKKIIIVMGSKGKSLTETYDLLKKDIPQIPFILMDSMPCKIRKKDSMVILPGEKPLDQLISDLI